MLILNALHFAMVEAEGPIADWRAIMSMAEDYVSQYLAEQPTGGRLQLYKVRRGDRTKRQLESKGGLRFTHHFPLPWSLMCVGLFSQFKARIEADHFHNVDVARQAFEVLTTGSGEGRHAVR